jgi:hypothetical protein
MAKRALYGVFILLILLSLAHRGGQIAEAQEDVEEPPERQTTLVVPFTEYEWWLIRWTDNLTVCQLFVEHEGPPTAEEVAQNCSAQVYQQWLDTEPCEKADQGREAVSTCLGLYFHQVGFRSGEQSVVVNLPPPVVWLNISGCALDPPQNLCQELPSLILTGEEPLPNERITAIHAMIAGETFTCEAEVCEIPLQPTPLAGAEMEFWADSSFGDSSQHFTALIRVLDTGVTESPVGTGWYVDVLSSQWQGGPVESCAQVWQAFPPAGGPPYWLTTPSEQGLLATGRPYHYLAGRLIFQGLVDASDCPANGLLANGYANACGIERARPMVDLWQNQFDPRIISVAKETGLPAQLLKNLFAQESQFWPGVFRVAREYGLGQITDQGADTILLWNESFFDQFCPLVLNAEACGRGYLRLKEDQRAILRGALAVQANADCAECPAGIDLTHADFSVLLFAQGLLANCDQINQTVFNATQSIPGAVSSYEDLWRFTIANYHAGPGCTAFAIHSAWGAGEALDWENVSARFTEPCQGAVAYVELITR